MHYFAGFLKFTKQIQNFYSGQTLNHPSRRWSGNTGQTNLTVYRRKGWFKVCLEKKVLNLFCKGKETSPEKGIPNRGAEKDDDINCTALHPFWIVFAFNSVILLFSNVKSVISLTLNENIQLILRDYQFVYKCRYALLKQKYDGISPNSLKTK